MAEENSEFQSVNNDLPAEDNEQVSSYAAVKNFFSEKINNLKNFKWPFPWNGETAGHIMSQNIAFYRNEIESSPFGDTIENILKIWEGNYHCLEGNHSYIQWLFPNRIPGMNSEASVLTDEDVEVISNTPELRERVKRAFEMMLDFYGMKLTRDNEFYLAENYPERLKKLNRPNNHNFARISRILLALKELGHHDLMLPWLKFLADLVYREKNLNCAASSLEKFWIDTLDAEDSIKLKQYIEQLKTDDAKASTTPDPSDSDTDDSLPVNSNLPTTNNTALFST